MSNGELVNQPTPSTETSTTLATPAELPIDVTRAVWQLRVMVCGLGAALLVSSLTFNAFVWKQNRNITAQTSARGNQVSRLQASQQRLMPAVQELARYSAGKPELTAVFGRFGIDLSTASAGASAPAAAPQSE